MAKKYIVIGAGWFGVRAVRAIEAASHGADITVLQIGTKDYVDINIANPRLVIDPDMVDKAYQPLSKAWKGAKLVNIKEVKDVTSGHVVVIDMNGVEKTYEPDGIVVATGMIHSSPLLKDAVGSGKEERRAQFTKFRDAVKNSKAGVLIIGGGTTGVELAGEIGTDFPNTNCTVINRQDLLLNNTAKRAAMHKIVMKQLTKLGVKVVLGDSILDQREDYMGPPKTFTSKKGTTFEADIVVICVGGRPNVPFAPSHALDARTKGLLVNSDMICSKLGSDPSKPVWAVGDCTTYCGRGAYADPQTAALKASVQHFEKTGTTNGGPKKYHHKDSEKFPGLVSVGRHGGAMSLPVPNKMMGKAFKAKDLGIAFMYNKEFKIKV